MFILCFESTHFGLMYLRMSRIIRMIVSKIMFDMFEKQLCFPRKMLISLQLDLFWQYKKLMPETTFNLM